MPLLVPVEAQMLSLDVLLSAADSACYAAKDAGRNRIHLYQADDAQMQERRGEMQWVNRLRQALDADLLRLYVQPIYPISERDSQPGYEVLVRLLGNDGQVIPPGAFMPAAERYDLASAIDRYVVLIIPFIAIMFPLLKTMGPLYRWRVRARVYRWYEHLRRIDKLIYSGKIKHS